MFFNESRIQIQLTALGFLCPLTFKISFSFLGFPGMKVKYLGFEEPTSVVVVPLRGCFHADGSSRQQVGGLCACARVALRDVCTLPCVEHILQSCRRPTSSEINFEIVLEPKDSPLPNTLSLHDSTLESGPSQPSGCPWSFGYSQPYCLAPHSTYSVFLPIHLASECDCVPLHRFEPNKHGSSPCSDHSERPKTMRPKDPNLS